ncbi:MAG TPA: hypothetical protein PK400_04460 [Phycisphaerales bacterium]|nr:hypothetical protein [Phycisphaerales bacterium]HRQ75624.1 hypothetical protein [Phycisphaerales bacterium]
MTRGARFPHLLLFCTILAAGFSLYRPVAAQTPGLETENARLAAELAETKKKLDAANKRIAELEQEVARLNRRLAGQAANQGTVADEEATIDETDPAASPRALFNALVKSYEEATEGLTLGATGPAGERERTQYLRALRQWRASANRQLRAPIAWHVRVIDAEYRGRSHVATLVAVDPVNGVELGESFQIIMPPASSRRYEQLRARGEIGVLVLRGVLIPDVRINEDRREAGIFNRPKLIGPYAEFFFSVEARTLLPAAEDSEQKSPAE